MEDPQSGISRRRNVTSIVDRSYAEVGPETAETSFKIMLESMPVFNYTGYGSKLVISGVYDL